jgi:hypothetical protein
MPANYEVKLADPASVIHWLRTWVVVGKDDECWPTIGNVGKNHGYGIVSQEVFGVQKQIPAHRIMWELFNGPIEEDMVIDHMCHNEAYADGTCEGGVCLHRRCVNPAHLQMITKGENSLLGAGGPNSIRGVCRNQLHDWIPENIIERDERRWCKLCYAVTRRENAKRQNTKRRAATAAKREGK